MKKLHPESPFLEEGLYLQSRAIFELKQYNSALEILNELEKVLIIKNAKVKKNDGRLKGKTFLVTGKLNGISRAEAKSLIEENSGVTVSSVSKKLDYLIVGEKPTKRKLDNAKELKIKAIDQKEFLKLINKTS